MKTMQPIIATQIDQHQEYIYEVKYDGFRVLVYMDSNHIKLISRKEVDLTAQFPEIVSACKQFSLEIKAFLPIVLDGELVVLNNPLQGNFSQIQSRGRLKNTLKIMQAAKARPATFIIFDLLTMKGKSLHDTSLVLRKKQLERIAPYMDAVTLIPAKTYSSYPVVKDIVFTYGAEGIVAKRKNSKYRGGKQHYDWIKEKNWKKAEAFLTAYDTQNGYFNVGIYHGEGIKSIGQCKHGLDPESQSALQRIFLEKGDKQGTVYQLPPAICARINTLGMVDGELREPQFDTLLSEVDADTCTLRKLKKDMAMLPAEVQITNEDKLFWPEEGLMKLDHILYMRSVYPLMAPYISHKAITIIRCPEGVDDTCFFQKHLPDYAPDYIDRHEQKLVCESLATMIWHANHSAIEFHVPFSKLHSPYPDSIVFDLDPPSRSEFPMAIKAAVMFKEVLDELELNSFVKTSGNKGLQIHLPLPLDTFTYEDTANFTENIAHIMIQAAPEFCTIERFKQKRKGRLYIDYVQHGRKKTIIAPYSPRKVSTGAVATPLFWSEVADGLSSDDFTIKTVPDRIQKYGCPWQLHYEKARSQSFEKALPLFQ